MVELELSLHTFFVFSGQKPSFSSTVVSAILLLSFFKIYSLCVCSHNENVEVMLSYIVILPVLEVIYLILGFYYFYYGKLGFSYAEIIGVFAF